MASNNVNNSAVRVTYIDTPLVISNAGGPQDCCHRLLPRHPRRAATGPPQSLLQTAASDGDGSQRHGRMETRCSAAARRPTSGRCRRSVTGLVLWTRFRCSCAVWLEWDPPLRLARHAGERRGPIRVTRSFHDDRWRVAHADQVYLLRQSVFSVTLQTWK
jgi:hypothetical protein